MRKTKIGMAAATVFATVATIYILYLPYDFDFYYYLSAGKLFFEHGLSLFYDQHTVIFSGKEIVPSPWIFSLLVGAADQIGGAWGLLIFRALVYLAPVLGILYLGYFVYRRPVWQAFFGAVLLPVVFASRPTFRPEVPSYFFAIVTLFAVERFMSQNRAKYLWCLPPLFVLWGNTHATLAMGYMILFIFIFTHVITHWKQKALTWSNTKTVFAVAVACLIAGAVSPYPFSYHPLMLALQSDSGKVFAKVISEFKDEYAFRTLGFIVIWIMFAFEMLKAIRAKDFFWIVLLGVYGIYAMLFGKVVMHMAIPVVFSFIANSWSGAFNLRWQNVALKSQYLVVAVGLVVTLLSPRLQYSKLSPHELLHHPKYQPVEVAKYIKSAGLESNFFVREYISGYLVYAVPQKIKVAATIMYKIVLPESFLVFMSKVTADPVRLNGHLQKWSYDYIVESSLLETSLLEHAPFLKSVKVLWLGLYSVLFSIEGDGFELATELMMDPSCIDKQDLNALSKEKADFDKKMSDQEGENFAKNLLEIAIEYKKAKSFAEFKAKPLESKTPWTNRLLAYLYLKHGEPQIALQALAGLEQRNIYEQLLAAEAMIKLGKSEHAWDLLNVVDLYLVSRSPRHLKKFKALYLPLIQEYGASMDQKVLEERKKLLETGEKLQSQSDYSFLRRCGS